MGQKVVDTESAQSISVDNPFERMTIIAAQVTIYPLLLLLRLLFVRNKLYRDTKQLNLRKLGTETTYVLYANHQSKLDPLIICGSLPLKTIRQLLPFNFFVANEYFKGPMKTFLNAMGGFPAFYHPTRPYGLDKARALIASNQTVVIFPQGRRTRDRTAKPGISILATEPNTYLIPVHIDGSSASMTSADIKTLYAEGNEVGSHTVTHPYLTQETAAQVATELSQSKTTLQNLIGAPIVDFAMPYGATNASVDAQVAQYYQSDRLVKNGYNSEITANLKPYGLYAYDITDTISVATAEGWINQAVAQKAWLIILMHNVTPALISGNADSTTNAILQSTLAYLQSQRIDVETVKDARAEISNMNK